MKNFIIPQWEGKIEKNKNNVYYFLNSHNGKTFVSKKDSDNYSYCVENGCGKELRHGICSWEEAEWL